MKKKAATPTPSDGMKTVPELARFLNVSENTVWRMVLDGRVKSIKIGKSRRIHSEEVARIASEGI